MSRPRPTCLCPPPEPGDISSGCLINGRLLSRPPRFDAGPEVVVAEEAEGARQCDGCGQWADDGIEFAVEQLWFCLVCTLIATHN